MKFWLRLSGLLGMMPVIELGSELKKEEALL
jgi:hypothetical protein